MENGFIPSMFTPGTASAFIDKTAFFNLSSFINYYGQNKGGNNLAYSYLTQISSQKDYFVASIHHELTTDSLIPTTGIPQIVRRPFCANFSFLNFIFLE